MGTRADFYVGIGPRAEWLGSISFDGGPTDRPIEVLAAANESEFRQSVERLFEDSESVHTRPTEGWPWPWEDSRTTDYAYAWCPDGVVRLSAYGCRWETAAEHRTRNEQDEDGEQLTDAEVVDMTDRKMGAEGILAKSGLMLLATPQKREL